MITNDEPSTTPRGIRLSSTAVVASMLAAAGLAVAAPVAHASTTPPPPTITPFPVQPRRTPGPTPTSPAYVAPVLLPTSDYITSAANDSLGDLTITIKTTSQALAPFASAPSSLAGRILVTTPKGLHQMVAQVTSATESATAWTIVTKRVSAMAALAPADYAIKPDFARAYFAPNSGVTMHPIAASGGSPATETFEMGPYTKTIQCPSGAEVDLNADLTLTPWISADADLGWTSLNSAHLIAGLDETAKLSASTNNPTTAELSCPSKVTLGTLNVPIDIGPLVAKVSFALKADLTATLQPGTLGTSVTQSFSGEAGVQYDGDTWSIVDGAHDQIAFQPPSATGTTSIEAGLTAEAKLSFYDIISAQLDLRAYAGIKLQAPPNPLVDLYAGAKLTYEIDAAGFEAAHGILWSTGDVDLFHTPVITTTKLPGAHWGPAGFTPGAQPTYSTQLAADGGSGSFSYALIGGALPNGGRLSSSGLISGTPKAPIVACEPPCTPAPTPDQTFTFTVQVTDSVGLTGSRQLSLTVATVHITTTSLPNAILGQTYSANMAAGGVVGTATWQVVGGRLPSGLTLSTAGRIRGVPNTPGTTSFTVQVTDSTGQSATATKSITTVCQNSCQ
jgi:Putative Ig domain